MVDPQDRQLQVALEHGGVDLQPHATSSRTALGAMSALHNHIQGQGYLPLISTQTQTGWLCIQEGPVCQQHATIELADVHVWCALLHTLWLAEDFLSWEGPSSSWTVCISSRCGIPQPPHSTERKGNASLLPSIHVLLLFRLWIPSNEDSSYSSNW